MAWNEPGNNGNDKDKDKDPWGGGNRGGGDQGPPDIDEVIRKISKKFNSLLGGKGGGGTGSGSSGSPMGSGGLTGGMFVGLILVAAVVWGFLGFYTVDQAEQGVVMRFGKVIDEVLQPGLHWNPPIIDEVTVVNTQELNTETYSSRATLTTDENIIDIAVTVQYLIQDPVKFVIEVANPKLSLDNSAESAIRHVVGGNSMEQILTTGRELVAVDVKERLQNYMDAYETGIFISQVNVENTQPPDNVRPAFDDVIRAREDEQRAQNEAQQYSNRVIPNARGEAQRQIEQANAYKEQVIARAEGDASRFEQLRIEYAKAPEVTRQRMYIDSLQDVLSASSKVMVDVDGGNNMLYLPLDKMMGQGSSVTGGNRPNSAQEWRELANDLAPYLPGPSSSSAVDRSRLTNTRGARP